MASFPDRSKFSPPQPPTLFYRQRLLRFFKENRNYNQETGIGIIDMISISYKEPIFLLKSFTTLLSRP